MIELLDGRGNGRLLAFDLATRALSVVLSGLQFPNGIVGHGRRLIFVECNGYRINEYDLESRVSRVLAENLPGYPDNLWLSEEGRLWVGLTSLRRGEILEFTYRYPRIRELLASLPRMLSGFIEQMHRYGCVAELDLNGTVLRTLHDRSGRVHTTTGAQLHKGVLFVTSLKGQLARLEMG